MLCTINKEQRGNTKAQKAQHPTTENTKATSNNRDSTTSTKERQGKHSQTLSALTTRGHSTKITLLPHNPAEGI
jgi:hypothetical protein